MRTHPDQGSADSVLVSSLFLSQPSVFSLRVLDVPTRKHCFRTGAHFLPFRPVPSLLDIPQTFLLIADAVTVCLLNLWIYARRVRVRRSLG
jgi:hypothetical protein